MSGDRVAVVELVIVCRQGAAVLKLNAPSIYTAHFCQLAICGAEIRPPSISCQQEPFSRSHFDLMTLMHRERPRLCWTHHALYAVLISGYYVRCVRTFDDECFMF